MAGWDVLSDFVKIGVPSLLTGITAYLIARAAWRHEEKTERRTHTRRTLEQVASTLSAVHREFHRHVLYEMDVAFKGIKHSRQELEDRLENLKLWRAGVDELEKSFILLEVIGHNAIVPSVVEYLDANKDVREAFARHPAITREEFNRLDERLTKAYTDCVTAIGTQYQKI